MTNKAAKIALLAASAGVLLAIGIIIGINVNIHRTSPECHLTGEHAWTLERGLEGDMIYDNFWSFARASYILVGTIPDCQFYKIVPEVPRNDYDVEQFYIDDDSSRMFYHGENGERVTRIAIDVSAFQPYIDWDAVKAAGVDVAMLRVGYRGYGSGALVEDEMFAQHAEAAAEAGLQVGVYFYTQALNYEEGVEEANFVLNAINGHKITCPIAIDTEFLDAADARTNGMDNAARTDAVVGFCETIRNSGHTPMIYSNRNWYAQSLDMSRLGGYKLWLAHYANQPDFPYVYVGWQYTDQGQIQGIDGNVDLNVWFE